MATLPNDGRKIYIICPSVPIHDPTYAINFQEHHVVNPLFSLRKLHEVEAKMDTKPEQAMLATEACKFLLSLTDDDPLEINGGTKVYDLTGPSQGKATGCLIYYRHDEHFSDIVQVVLHMKRQREFRDREVILVTKNVTTRAIARASGIIAQDYLADMVSGRLRSGVHQLPDTFWKLAREVDCLVTRNGDPLRGFILRGEYPFLCNEYVYFAGEPAFAGIVLQCNDSCAVIAEATDYTREEHNIYGATARNHEQNALMNLLMDPDITFVSGVGLAGSGKTFLSVAAGLAQTVRPSGSSTAPLYDKVIYIRPQVGVGSEKEMGAVKGGKEEKLAMWRGPVDDNLKILAKLHKEQGVGGKQNGKQYDVDIMNKHIESEMTRMVRGRSISNSFIIVDEGQNLTPHQAKTLISRAGSGSKIVYLGDLTQIDSPFLNPQSSGLTRSVYKLRGCAVVGHVELTECERSELSRLAAELL